MILNEALADYLEPLTEKEKVYKRIHEMLLNKESIDSYVQELRNDGFPLREIHLTSVNLEYNINNITYIFYPNTYDISIFVHKRFNPPFLHSHEFFELIYQINGSSENLVNGEMVLMDEGDICFVPPGSVHSLKAFEESSIAVNILIKPNTIDDLLHHLYDGDNLFSEFFGQTKAYYYMLFHTKGNLTLQNLLENLILEYFGKNVYKIPLLKTMLLSAFTLLLREHFDDMVLYTNDSNMEISFYQLHDYLQRNFRTAILTETAKFFNFSPVYFSKKVYKNTGYHFNEILKNIKFSNACSMLVDTKMSIGEIAYCVGYENQEYFSRVFKSIYKKTPMEYRRTLLNK